jgi:hypothetical protein
MITKEKEKEKVMKAERQNIRNYKLISSISYFTLEFAYAFVIVFVESSKVFLNSIM